MGLLISLFQTSGDVWPGFQSQGKIIHLHTLSLAHNRLLRFTLVRHLLTSWRPAWQPSRFIHILVRGSSPGSSAPLFLKNLKSYSGGFRSEYLLTEKNIFKIFWIFDIWSSEGTGVPRMDRPLVTVYEHLVMFIYSISLTQNTDRKTDENSRCLSEECEELFSLSK